MMLTSLAWRYTRYSPFTYGLPLKKFVVAFYCGSSNQTRLAFEYIKVATELRYTRLAGRD